MLEHQATVLETLEAVLTTALKIYESPHRSVASKKGRLAIEDGSVKGEGDTKKPCKSLAINFYRFNFMKHHFYSKGVSSSKRNHFLNVG